MLRVNNDMHEKVKKRQVMLRTEDYLYSIFNKLSLFS